MSGSRLQERVAVVAGSSRGLGRAIAEALAAEGATVVVNSRDAETARTVAREIGEPAYGIGADVAEESGCRSLIAETVARFGRIDILVNNAGASLTVPTEEMAVADWRRIVDLNLTGPFILSRQAARHMLAEGRSAILNIASVAATSTPPRRAAYVAAKAGLLGLTKVMAAEWTPAIRVNALAPGFFETDLIAEAFDSGLVDRGAVVNRVPYRRLGRPEELARAAVYLVSDDAEYISGAVLPVDGGWLVFGHNV